MAHTSARPDGWLTGWDPEDEDAWHKGGHRAAHRDLILSVLSEHVGFSVWALWSVLVLFMSPEIGHGFSPGEKFLLVATPTVVGSLLRLPHSYAVTRFSGRTSATEGPQTWSNCSSPERLLCHHPHKGTSR
ncbi:hypothetical protein [Streptomyces sp. NPDC058751]|uniref:hypothetical protein n=1 Tax=Streptomyces sp. NPDC058751 TaxID=3346623 RepID=UPI0036B777D6